MLDQVYSQILSKMCVFHMWLYCQASNFKTEITTTQTDENLDIATGQAHIRVGVKPISTFEWK